MEVGLGLGKVKAVEQGGKLLRKGRIQERMVRCMACVYSRSLRDCRFGQSHSSRVMCDRDEDGGAACRDGECCGEGSFWFAQGRKFLSGKLRLSTWDNQRAYSSPSLRCHAAGSTARMSAH